MHRHIINRKSQVTRSKGLLSLWPSAWKTIGCWPLGGPVNAFLLKMGPARPNIFGLSLRMLGSLLQTKEPRWPESESNLDRELRIHARIRLFLFFLYFFWAWLRLSFTHSSHLHNSRPDQPECTPSPIRLHRVWVQSMGYMHYIQISVVVGIRDHFEHTPNYKKKKEKKRVHAVIWWHQNVI